MTWEQAKSEALFALAKQRIPGGVNSPVRGFRSVGGTPPFIARGKGSRVWDVDGHEYIDYLQSWGPLILGHAPADVVAALQAAVALGTSYGAPTELEVEMAGLVQEAYPSMELLRMVNSGTEATMSAIRVARAYTKRTLVVKFVGCYHGHGDAFLVKAGSGATDMGVPDSPGVPAELARQTVTVPYNDLGAVRELFAQRGEEIAAVIVEPVVGNFGMVQPLPGFLPGLRAVCTEYGSVLIFDEVLCGFRLAFGGAQERYGIRADLTTLGKVVGGGLPVGCYGGKREIMSLVAPAGPVYQAGTLSGNPLAMTAGIVQLKALKQPGVYPSLERKTQRLTDGMRANLQRLGLNYQVGNIGSLFGFFFTETPVLDYDTATTADTKKYAAYFHYLLEHGVYMAPSQFEAGFMSLAHSDADIDETVARHYEAVQAAEGK